MLFRLILFGIFANLHVSHMIGLLGAVLESASTNSGINTTVKTSFHEKDTTKDSGYLPIHFDLYCFSISFISRRDVDGKNYLSSLRNQDIPTYCGSGWALSVASALGDRFRYQTSGMWPTHELAAQVLINCDEGNYGCSGGDPYVAYKYIYDYGIPDESCLPLTGTEERCIPINVCRSCTDSGICDPVFDYSVYSISDYGRVSTVKPMQKEIYYHGTITCSISVTSTFRNYRRGILTDDSGRMLFKHVVSIVGWGEENGIPYWIVRSTWGSYWGENGFARVLRGYDLFGIESDCSYGIPLLYANQTKKVESNPSANINIRNFISCGYPTDWTLVSPVIISPLPSSYVNVSSLPLSWDIRSLYGRNYASPNKNQHSPQFCNSCWAQATATALSDRLNLRNNGKWPLIELSAQMILNCADGSCSGGDTGEAYRLGYLYGLSDRTCQAYEGRKKECDSMGRCMDCNRDGCWAVESYRKVYVEEFGEVQGIDNMKAEIYARGPITCFMVMTEEFMNYEGGIFVEHDHAYKGGHIVEVAGWGYNSVTNQRYWIARNNWGNAWGEEGWFRINMGGSNLMIESSCSWGVPSAQFVDVQ